MSSAIDRDTGGNGLSSHNLANGVTELALGYRYRLLGAGDECDDKEIRLILE